MVNRLSKTCAVAVVVAGLLLAGCSSNSSGNSNASASPGCTPAHTFSSIASGKLTVAAPEFAPFVSLTGGAPNGIDVDIVEAIAHKECLSTNYVQVDYSGAVPAVQSGRADLAIGDYYRTTSRSQIVGLTDPVYTDGMGLISKDGVSDIPTMLTRRVGTVDGYLWVADLKKLVGDSLKIYKSNTEMWADLTGGRIDVGIDSIPVGALHASQNGSGWKVATAQPDNRIGASVQPAQAGMPYTKSNTALGTALNEDIKALRDDGTLASIFTKHGADPNATQVSGSYLLNS